VQAKNITVLGGQVLIGEIGPEITEISLAATTGMVTVTTTAPYDTDKYSVGAKILIDVSGTYASATWANGYFIIASTGASTLTYQSEDLVSGPLSDASAGGFIYLGSQMAVGGDGGSAAAWMTVEGNKFALRNPADPLVTVIEATAGAVTINADFINAGSLNIGDLDANALTATNFSVTNAGVMTAGSGNNVAVISPTDATYRLWLGHSTGAAAPFSVTSTGAISATSGSVGGWTLSSTSFTGGDTTIASAGDITLGTGENVARLSSSDAAYRLWLGGSTASTAPFRVTSTGALTATGVDITGAVSASSGQIGGFAIGATSLTAGSGATAVGIIPASFPFFAGSSTASTAPFRVTSTGSLTATSANITGTISTSDITATGGTIGGWGLSSTSLTGGDTTIAATGDITLGTGANVARLSSSDPAYRLWLGGSTASTAPFRVTSTGAVTATDANISGTVTATSGAIGGWVLSSTSFTGGDTTINSTGDITLGAGSNVARLSSSDPAYRLWLGGSTASTAPFRVTSAGELTATSASITGTITANSGAIGTWTISNDAITSIDNGGDYSGLYHSDLDSARAFFAGASSTSGASASFYVQNDGSLYANSATISGSITATSGSIGTWTIDDDGISSIDVGGEYSGLYHSDANAGRAFFAGATSQSGAAAKFYVQNDGALYAESATITGAVTATSGSFTGSITANSGSIGGWAVDSTKIYNALAVSPFISGMQGSSTSTGVAFFAGGTTSTGTSAAFTVTNAGSVTATNLEVTGGGVGGWKIDTDKIYNALASTPFISGLYRTSTSTGLAFFAGGTTSTGTSAAFSINNLGAVNASNMTITGGSMSIGSFFSVGTTGATTLSSLTVSSADGTRPGIYVNKSSSVGDIGVPTGQVFNVGHWSGSAFTERLRLDASGQMRLYDGYFAVGRSSDVFRVDTSGLVSVGNGTSVAGDLRVYGNGSSGNNGAVRIYGGTPGTTNGGTLSWDGALSRFNMNNDLNIAGALTGATTIAASSTITATGVINANSTAAVGLQVLNGIEVGATDGIYFGVDTSAPNIFFSAGWRFTQITSGSSAVDAVWSTTTGTGTLVRVTSSERYKQNIVGVDYLLSDIVALSPSEYEYKEQYRGVDEAGNPLPVATQVGIIAEHAVGNPAWEKLIARGDDGQIESWRYSQMGPVLLSAVRQLNEKITALESRVAQLEGA
jgi:hypothetical protein